MKKLFKVIIVFILGFLFYKSPFARDPLIISGHPNYPPLTWQENGEIVGVAIELAKTVFTELNIPYTIKATGPWKRVQQNAKEGLIDVITSIYLNAERNQYLDYTISFTTDPSVIFVLKGNAFPFNKWEDLIGRQGITTLGESYGEEFDRFIEQYLKIDRVKSHLQNFKMLEKGRVDYILFPLYPGRALAIETGYMEKIEILPLIAHDSYFYMAFSKKSNLKHLLAPVNQIITRLIQEGAIDQWFLKYEDRYEKTRKNDTP